MISIRLARGGAKKRPFYHIVVSDVRKPRDGGYIERIGYYNQRACGQEVRLHLEHERADYWLSQGAKPTKAVATLLKQAAKNRPAAPVVTEAPAVETPSTETEAPAAEVASTEAA